MWAPYDCYRGATHASCAAIPVNTGSTPAASIATRPRLWCTQISAYFPVEAECTQHSFPATRGPVSSKCTTGAAVIRSRTRSRTRPDR